VSSEHDKNRRSDVWRASHVVDLVSEKGHPLQKFATGNKETLAGDNRPALLDFYKKYYSASNMKLAMISNRPLREQVELVKKYFLGIPNRPVSFPPIDPNYRKPLDGKFRLMKIKTIKDIRSLKLKFPTIRLKDYQESKPASIVSFLIGHEGKGSLLSKLKAEGLALGLSAGGSAPHDDINTFDITVSLTKKGVENYERILELIFSYIRMIREHGVEEYTFKERQTMAQINFDWKDPEEGIRFVASKAAVMQEYDLKDVETLPYLFVKFDPQGYRAVLDTLTPQNMLTVLQTNSVETDRVEKYYGTEYSIAEVGGSDFEKLAQPPREEALHYPEPNQFIPYHLTLTSELPHLVRDDDLAKVWFKFDNRFKQPKVNLKIRIETPYVYDTVDNYARSKLYEAAIQEELNEMVYPIRLAGLSYSLGLEKKGVVLVVGGYSEKISDLMELVAENLTKVEIDPQKFANIKEAIIRGWRNRKLGSAYARGAYYNRLLLLVKQYEEDDVIKALEPLTLDDIKVHAKKLYERVYLTGVAHGNWTDDDVRAGVQTLLDKIKGRPLPEKDRYVEKVEVLDSGARTLFSKKVDHNNNSIDYTLQVGPFDPVAFATASLISSIIQADFYTQMRTKQQLGYIVLSYNRRIEDRLFFKFIIQSATHDSFDLLKRVEAWLAESDKLLENLSDDEFERQRKSLVISLEKEGDSIGEVADDLYYLAAEEKGNFEFKKQLIEIVKKIEKKEVLAAAKKLFRDSVTPRLVVMIRSRDNQETLPEGVLTRVDRFKNGKSG
ncbi:MAG: insulinase family protein, partial [Nitrospinales bacterium]